MNNTIQIHKNSTTFNVTGCVCNDGNCPINWFPSAFSSGWEIDTFHILDHYSNKDKIYIDIGAWIGPTVLYSADKFKRITCFEPDHIALKKLIDNVNVNNFTNIKIHNKAISNKNGKTVFGGNGPFGNSMSSMIETAHVNSAYLTEVDTITLHDALINDNIEPVDISLIKMDIEGGEIIVVPFIIDFLRKYKPSFYISLHRMFVPDKDIDEIVEQLFTIYTKCFVFDRSGNKIEVTKQEVLNRKIPAIVFE
jgi:FkbM family methyltransferase